MRLPPSPCHPVVVATLGALIAFACGGGGTSSSPASPTQPTARPAAFTIAVQILQIATGGVGTVGPEGPSGSQFWFFEPNQYELAVKALNHCYTEERWWMFVASTTNVEFTLTVTDTQTGSSRRYFNPLGTWASPFTDTQAFATCP